MLEMKGLTKAFNGREVVKDLDLVLPPGTLFSFLGPNGAGKTTTIKMAVGLLRPTRGAVRLFGQEVGPSAGGVKQRIGYVPDQPYLYDKLTGLEFLRFVARMFGMDPADAGREIARLSETFELRDYVRELCESYSHGMKQRVVLASALLHRPDVFIVDEPMVGLDPKSAHLLKRLMREMTARGGIVFMSTHTLAIAEEISDLVGIIHNGRLLALGAPAAVRSQASGAADLEAAFLRMTQDAAKEPG